ncbi:MarR family winged helix-turn-helix transcriptional regulator [Cellulomonas fengjieae]|uniref:MarR family transcriptional regulator n=1 Tax=Cellulomonas fengjieae TaxID=2819978 RepID=A0ABS3SEC4_9CELL|nr:MarR family winged helix-turn-helix transcriptional regulator [Cellulomonas fengjieae]MBO3084108.1 MarR family transcriptional regulator [Cellulomonas fengjieae]QVI64637.1 MarR family transcriptional regulator [Cellulomonas fengjieae]
MFALLEAPAGSQKELAARAGVTRVRVTQVLEELENLVERSRRGWAARDRRDLAAWLVERYPSSPHLASTWTMLEPPVQAAALVSGLLEKVEVQHGVSGDVAADAWAAWARPRSAWLWSASLVDLGAVGATPAAPESATLTLAVSEDPHLLEAVRRGDGRVPLLSPWRAWADLTHAGNALAADALLGRLTR